MKRLLAVALLISLPVSAFAATLTGKVRVMYPRCFGCPPVAMVGDKQITGSLALDVAAFDGRTITLSGEESGEYAFDAAGFAPGESSRFVTGTVELADPNCPPNARCMAKVYVKTADGRKIVVKDGALLGLTGLEGATVTLRGDVVHYRCAPGTRCLGGESTLTVDEGSNLWVRGRIEKLAHGMNGQTHTLTIDNGESVLVAGKKAWDDRNFSTVWINGKMTFERISGQPMLKGSSASKAVPVVPAVDPFFPLSGLGDTGTNVPRDAGTNGAVTAGSSSGSVGGADAAGIRR